MSIATAQAALAFALLVACSSATFTASDVNRAPAPQPVKTVDQYLTNKPVNAHSVTAAAVPTCGDGKQGKDEECDDGNTVNGDGCSVRCRAEAVQVASNGLQTCIVTSIGGVKCWGENGWGQLGYGDTNNRGDDPGEMGEALGHVDLGDSKATRVAPGRALTCAILEDGNVKCWGGNRAGSKPDTMGAQLKPEALGERTVLLDAANELCAVLEGGAVKCMTNLPCNNNGFARDNCHFHPEKYRLMWTPVLIHDRRRIVQITSGVPDCVLLDDGAVKCWGASWPGVGHSVKTMKSDLFRRSVPDVPLKTKHRVLSVAANFDQVCVILETGDVGCWGEANSASALGYYTSEKNEFPGHPTDIEEPPSTDRFWHTGLPQKLMRFGSRAKQVLPSPDGGCVLLENGQIKCWMARSFVATEETAGPVPEIIDGQVSSPPTYTIKMPLDCVPKDVSMAGNFCVLCTSGCLKCWGDNSSGQLGYGDTKPRQEPPEQCVSY